MFLQGNPIVIAHRKLLDSQFHGLSIATLLSKHGYTFGLKKRKRLREVNGIAQSSSNVIGAGISQTSVVRTESDVKCKGGGKYVAI